MTFDDIHDIATSIMHEIEDKLSTSDRASDLALVLGRPFSSESSWDSSSWICDCRDHSSVRLFTLEMLGNLSTDGLAYGALAEVVGGLLGGLIAARLFLWVCSWWVPEEVLPSQHTSNMLYLQRSSLMHLYYYHTCSSRICGVRRSSWLAKRQAALNDCKHSRAFCTARMGVLCKVPNLIDIIEGHVDDSDVDAQGVWFQIADCCTFGLGNPL